MSASVVRHSVSCIVRLACLLAATWPVWAGAEPPKPLPAPSDFVAGDDLYDLSTMNDARQAELYRENYPGTTYAKYDLRRKLPRHHLKETDPMYALNAIGKVTAVTSTVDDANFESSVKGQENKGWGTGFMISPCHMITNHHVVCDREVVNGIKNCTENKNLNGKKVNFSYGENTDGNDYLGRTTGQILTSNKRIDYAIVKIKTNDRKIPFLIPDFEPESFDDNMIAMVPGYAGEYHWSESHRPVGMKSRLSYNNTGHYLIGEYSSSPGMSGSPAVIIKNKRLTVIGQHIATLPNEKKEYPLSGKRSMFSFSAIRDDLMRVNIDLYSEINQAVSSGKCE